MYLTAEEEKILSGEQGPGPQRAMELLVALGRIYDADRLVPISSAHLSGVSYKTIGEGGIDFLKEMSKDTKVRVPTTLNPMGMDAERWKEMRVPERFSDRQLEIMRCYSSLGVRTTCSCTPYLGENVPRKGRHHRVGRVLRVVIFEFRPRGPYEPGRRPGCARSGHIGQDAALRYASGREPGTHRRDRGRGRDRVFSSTHCWAMRWA